MVGPFSDSTVAAPPIDNHALAEQLELSQKVQSLAPVRHAPATPSPAAPASQFDKFVDVSAEGLENIPQGILHSLHNPMGLAENAALSVAMGTAARLILPKSGPVGSLFAIGLSAYFAEQTAVPVYKAYRAGMRAPTMGGIHAAGRQLGDALGGLAVNVPIGIAGYKIGAGVGDMVTGSGGKLSGHVETTDRVEGTAVSDRAASKTPTLPERYLPVKENFSGTTVPGISQEFLRNLQTDDTGQYYGAGLRYPDVMADPEMANFINAHNQVTVASIDKAIYDQEVAAEAKAASYQLPKDWQSGTAGPPPHAIDVTVGGDATMRVGSKTFTLTDDGAPNRKLVVTDDASPGSATTLIPEQKDFEMQQVIQVQANGMDKYAVVGSKDGASVLHLYDADGKPVSEIALPGFGTLHDVRPGATASQLQFLYDTPIAHPRVLTVDLAGDKSSLSPLSSDVFDTDKFVTEKVIVPYADRDGTMQTVPFFLSRRSDMVLHGQNLSMLKIYGGFDVGPQYVGYSPSTASWLERGGVAVDPILPGDGGLGSANYKEGMGAGIQNADLALAAIIAKLHDMGVSSPKTTGIYGRSNGGMIVNTLLNSRPDLVGAAVSESGVNSLFDSPVINVDTGSYWVDEFGNPHNPADVAWMSRLDVLNNLNTAKNYPPTLIEVGTKDGVVNIGNGITYHALRQAMGNGETLLYSRIGEGHDPVNMNLALQTAFIWHRLSLPTS